MLTDAIASHPWIYDRIQGCLGREKTCRRLRAMLARGECRSVLDVGGGTGTCASTVPSGARYFCLDLDPVKLRGLKAKLPGARAIRGDATRLGVRDKSVDVALCVALAHHLDDQALPLLFQELARVTQKRLVFLDALKTAGAGVSNLLWRLDRGSHPRTEEALLDAIRKNFEIEEIINFRGPHHYLLVSARPRPRTDPAV